MRADFNLSRPRDASSYMNKTTILCETTLMKTLLPRKTGNKNVTFVTDKTRETDLPGRESRQIQMGSRVGQSTTRLFLQHTFTEKHPYSLHMHLFNRGRQNIFP